MAWPQAPQHGSRPLGPQRVSGWLARMLSRFHHIWLLVTPWTVICQAPLSIGFSMQEYWSRLSCSPPGDLPSLGIEPMSPKAPALQADSLPLSHRGSPGWLDLPKIIKEKCPSCPWGGGGSFPPRARKLVIMLSSAPVRALSSVLDTRLGQDPNRSKQRQRLWKLTLRTEDG